MTHILRILKANKFTISPFNPTYCFQLPILYDAYTKIISNGNSKGSIFGSKSEKCFGDSHVKVMSGILKLQRESVKENPYVS